MEQVVHDALVRVYRLLVVIGLTPPTNTAVFEAVRSVGHRFRDVEGKSVLAGERKHGPGLAPDGPLEISTRAPDGPGPAPAARSRKSRAKNATALTLPLLNGNGTAVAAPAPKAQLEPEWATALREDAKAMQRRSLPDLTEEERFCLARYHTLVFGHCRSREYHNRRLSRGAVTSLTALIEIVERRNIELTVGGYIQLARRFHEQIGGGPWYTPCDIKALLIVEPAVAR